MMVSMISYVMMTATTVDECGGGVIRHSDLCKVEVSPPF